MNIRLYQINSDRDSDRVGFLSIASLQRFQGSSDVNSKIYDRVFEGEVGCENLEDIYQKFNFDLPEGYAGRSMAVSDVVEIVNGDTSEFHFCDSIGFQKISFNPEEAASLAMPDDASKITVLSVRAGKSSKVIEIENTLRAMQDFVGGDIEEYMPFKDDSAIICNTDGKLMGLQLNRTIYDESHEVLDIIAGDFLLVYAPIESESFKSLPESLIEKYKDIFKYPERFCLCEDGIKGFPVRVDE